MIDIKPSQRNTNKHTKDGMDLLENSINKVGVIESISVASDGTIISGHARFEHFEKQGKKPIEIHLKENEYPVIVTDIENNSKEYFEAQILANTTANKNFDLDIEMIEVIAEEFDSDIEEIGVDVVEVEEDTILEAVEDDFDATPPEIPITVLGDLYEIGEHRLLCGDSTDSDQVAKLMNGNKADMVFTDPPYGVDFVGIKGTMYQNGKKKGKDSYEAIKNDDLKNESLTDLFYESISNAIINTKSNSAFYIFFGINKSKETIEAISNLDLEIRNWLIWDKGNVGFHAMGAQYKPNYESFLYCFKEGNPPEWVGNQQQQTIWRHSVERLGLHPTMKPITLISQAIENHNISSLLDLFLGSGSTMVASHQLKRKCYGMELDPKYCDVIVKRMIKLDDTLTVKRNGVDCTNEFKDL